MRREELNCKPQQGTGRGLLLQFFRLQRQPDINRHSDRTGHRAGPQEAGARRRRAGGAAGRRGMEHRSRTSACLAGRRRDWGWGTGHWASPASPRQAQAARWRSGLAESSDATDCGQSDRRTERFLIPFPALVSSLVGLLGQILRLVPKFSGPRLGHGPTGPSPGPAPATTLAVSTFDEQGWSCSFVPS
jgi:hypothetical protein